MRCRLSLVTLSTLALLAGLLVGTLVVAVRAAPSGCCEAAEPMAARAAAGGDRPAGTERARATVEALRVLHAWDRRRAAAYAEPDPRALRHLYAPASRAGARDVRLLQAYAARGLGLRGLTVQVLEGELLGSTPRLLRLVVEERVPRAVATSTRRDRHVALPGSRITRDVVTLVRVEGRWVVRSVRRG